jgi:hypothetical protein
MAQPANKRLRVKISIVFMGVLSQIENLTEIVVQQPGKNYKR